jgi:hypothetical protein
MPAPQATTTTSAPSRTSISSSGTQFQIFLIVVGFVVLAILFIETRVPDGRIPAALAKNPKGLLLAALSLSFPALLFGFIDFTKAREQQYDPPSLRVQVARAFVYGLALAGSNILLIVSQAPDLVWKLQHPQSWLPILTAASLPYAVGAWYLCLRPREFKAPELPTYQATVDSLADTDDFVVGIASEDPKSSVVGLQSWQTVPAKGMCGNIYVLGGIGSGKTSSVAKPLLEQAIFKWPHDSTRKNAVFALDAKGNMAEWIAGVAKEAGREEDVIILKPGGMWSYNPLAYGSPTAVAQKLVAALEAMTAQEPNSYYQKMQREFCENAMQVLSDVLGAGKVSLMDLYNFIVDPGTQKKTVDASAATNSISYRWFKTQWEREDPKEQMMLTKGFRADLSQFVRDEIAPTFANPNPNFPGWETLLNEGKIVVFSMSMDEYGDFARALGIFVLMDFQSVMLARTTPRFRAQKHNTTRLVLACIDECWAYMNPKLAEFTSVSREAVCCTLALHQSLGQILNENMRQVMLGNFRTPIILAINDLLSLDTFSKLFGTHKTLRRSFSESSGFAGVEHQVLSDHLRGKMGGESKSLSTSLSETDEARFSTDEILHLAKNHAVIQMFDGDTTHEAHVIQTLPHYLDAYKFPGTPS